MQEITGVALGIGLTYILFNVFYRWIDAGLLWDVKPFNCHFCISVWLGICLSFDFGVWCLTVPLLAEFTRKLINKI